VDENVFAAAILHDKAEALLTVEEFDDAFAFADDLGRHLRASTAAAEATAAAAAAEAITATAKAVAATTETVATAAAEAITATTETATAAEAVTATEATVETTAVTAEVVALVVATSAALAAPPSIKTHPSNNFLRNRVRPGKTNLTAGRKRQRFGAINTTHCFYHSLDQSLSIAFSQDAGFNVFALLAAKPQPVQRNRKYRFLESCSKVLRASPRASRHCCRRSRIYGRLSS
jgi:glucose/arabinose dehydrogenase